VSVGDRSGWASRVSLCAQALVRIGLVLFGLTLATLGSVARAHPPGMEDPERQQRRMELRQHLMQERERWRPESQGGPRETMRQEMRTDKRPEMRNDFHAEIRSVQRDDLRTERLTVEERRALRRAIREAQRFPAEPVTP
jgi:hypothetical protein